MRLRRPQSGGMRTLLAAILVVSATAAPLAAAPLTADVEVDPTAYALDGNSLHVGLVHEHLRLDLGVFGLALPRWAHGADGFAVRFDGFGAKLQWFPGADQRGLFVGVDASLTRTRVERAGRAATDRQVGVGVQLGYRIDLPADFYVTPWIGVGYQLGAADVTLDGETYEAMDVTVFPAVHVGYRFR